MAAFNWVLVPVMCPACGSSVRLRVQTHVASDYSGDERGRFHDREYPLGTAMNWWPEEHPSWEQWKVDGRTGRSEDGFDEEACRGTCPVCAVDLYVVIRFRLATPEAVVMVGLEAEWPEGYIR